MFDCTSSEEPKSNGTATVFEKGNKQVPPAHQEHRPWNDAGVLDATEGIAYMACSGFREGALSLDASFGSPEVQYCW